MNQSFLAASMAAVISLSVILPVGAADGIVNFTGKVIESGCTVDTGKIDINFGNVSKSSFSGMAVGAEVAGQKFNIKLSQCPEAISGAMLRFEGTSDKVYGQAFSLVNSGLGLGIAMHAEDGTLIVPNKNTPVFKRDTSGAIDIPLVATLKIVDKDIKAGDISAISNFTVVYP